MEGKEGVVGFCEFRLLVITCMADDNGTENEDTDVSELTKANGVLGRAYTSDEG